MPGRQLPLPHIYKIFRGRTSASAHMEKSKKGSITVEAAMAVPIFFFAVVSLLYLMEIMAVQTAVRCGLQDAGKQVAAEAVEVKMIIPAQLESDIVNSVGAGRLERSIVVGGSSGISCAGSYVSPVTGIGEIKAKYKVKIPIPMFHVPPLTYEEKMRIKLWTGYEKGGLKTDDDEIVYVTETGIVYHRDYHCTHLDLSIHMASSSELNMLRNESGGKYHP